MVDRIGCKGLAHVHVVVDDLDYAAEFYRKVLDFVEFQSHDNLSNAGLAKYYGWAGNPDDFRVSLRFLAWPDYLTLKLVRVRIKNSYKSPTLPSESFDNYAPKAGYAGVGVGPISVMCEDIESTFKHLSSYAQDYSAKYRITILSEPVFLSPLQPGEIGATKDSALYQQGDILDTLAKTFPTRSKFQMIDPFGVRWEFNNDVV